MAQVVLHTIKSRARIEDAAHDAYLVGEPLAPCSCIAGSERTLREQKKREGVGVSRGALAELGELAMEGVLVCFPRAAEELRRLGSGCTVDQAPSLTMKSKNCMPGPSSGIHLSDALRTMMMEACRSA
jgi:hypothetical protein